MLIVASAQTVLIDERALVHVIMLDCRTRIYL